MLLVIHHPGHLRRIEAEFVHQDLTRPCASRDRIGAYPYLLALEIPGRLDPRVWAYQQPGVVEAPDDKDGKRDERRAICACDDVGRWRQFAHVELDVANHAAEGADLRMDCDELGVNAFDRDGAVTDRRGMRMVSNCDLEVHFLGQLSLL